MLEITDYLFEIIVCAALGGLCLAIYLQRMELLRVRMMIRCERTDRQVLDNDVAALLACSRTIGERVRSQDARQHSMLQKIDVIDVNHDSNENTPYDQVHRLVEQGMEVEDIAKICNLRRGEVDLLSHIAVHRSAA